MEVLSNILVIVFIFCYVNVQTAPPTRQASKFQWTDHTFCPDDYFLTGIRPIFLSSSNSVSELPSAVTNNNKNSIYGFNISCDSRFNNIETRYITEIPLITETKQNISTLVFKGQLTSICKAPKDSVSKDRRYFGMGVGIEKRYHAGQDHERTLLEVSLYCNEKIKVYRRVELVQTAYILGLWTSPNFCPWGQYICGIKVKYDRETFVVHDVKTECGVLFKELAGWTNYRGATAGQVIQSDSASFNSEVGDLRPMSVFHYLKELDDPYYYGWKFCPQKTYVTGLQGQLSQRQFRLSCSDISTPYPRDTKFIETTPQESMWDWEDELSKHVECEGVVIGFQVLYGQVGDPIQGIRLFCSFATKKVDQLTYVKVLFPRSTSSSKAEFFWGEPQMCNRHQALCGFKTKDAKDSHGNSIGTEHMKAKCCAVPSIAEVCTPYDRFELVVECDARLARAATTCQYTFSEGMTISDSLTSSFKENQDLRNSLSREWSRNDADTKRYTVETGDTSTISESSGTSNFLSNLTSVNTGATDINTSGKSTSKGKTATSNKGSTTGSVRGKSFTTGSDKTKAFEKSKTHSDTSGFSDGGSSAHTFGQSQNFLNTKSQSNSFTDTSADTVGSSQGTVSGITEGSSLGQSSGKTASESESGSNTSGKTASRGMSFSATAGVTGSVEVEGSANWLLYSASVKARMETSFSATAGGNLESSEQSSSTHGNERSQGTSSQRTSEQSSSKTNQNTLEASNSNTRSNTSEKGNSDSKATGGESSHGFTGTTTHEKNQQKTTGGQLGITNSDTKRTIDEENFQQNSQKTHETSDGINHLENFENSVTKQSSRGRDDSSTFSKTDTADKSHSKSAHSSASSGFEQGATKGQSRGMVQDRTFSTGHDWSRSSGQSWTREKAYQVHMTVPPGVKSRLYQVVGYCDHFQIRTNNFKREDTRDPLLETSE